MAKLRRIRFSSADTARELALQALYKTDMQDSYSSILLSSLLEESALDARERSQATALFYGCLSRQQGLDFCLDQRSKNPLPSLDPLLRNALRLAAFQIYFSPHVPARAAVDTTVNLVKRYGHQGMAAYANAVLRALLRDLPVFPKSGAAAAGVSEAFYRNISEVLRMEPLAADAAEVEAYWQSINEIRDLSLRIRDAGEVEKISAELQSCSVIVKQSPWPPNSIEVELDGQSLTALASWKEGRIIAQGRAAQLPARIGALHKPKRALDLCAAPGGKSLQLYDLCKGNIAITACDLHAKRLKRMEENMQRLGVSALTLCTLDASLALPEKLISAFDLVMADVPCTASGLVDSKPELRFSDGKAEQSLLETQAAILKSAASALKPGGTLVYSTCSINPAENQQQVKRFMIEHHAAFDLLPLLDLPEALREQAFTKKQLAETPAMLNLYPHIHGCEGFFIAQLRRKK